MTSLPQATRPDLQLDERKAAQFREEGYCLIEDAIPAAMLEMLREECAYFVDRENRKMDALGVDVLDITHRDKRYFASFCLRERERLAAFLFGPTMEAICRKLLGDNAYLFYDMYVVKGADTGMELAWHQDSGYVNATGGDRGHRPYITCWCPLDDVDESNGTVYILPTSQSGIDAWVEHEHDPVSNDWVGYRGADPGVPVRLRAGGMAVFSSVTLHRSGPNNTPRLRRAFLAQYSPEPVRTADGRMLWGNAVPFLQGGRLAVGAAMPALPLRIDADPESAPKSAGRTQPRS